MYCEKDFIISKLVGIGYPISKSENMYLRYLQCNRLSSLLDFIEEKEKLRSVNRHLLQPEDYLE